MKVLVTGGAGFFGGVLVRTLTEKGHECVSIDLQEDDFEHPGYMAYQGDIRDLDTLNSIFSKHPFDVIIHCAAILAHERSQRHMLWTSNVDGTRNIAEMAVKFGVPRIIFTSSNCLWGSGFDHPVSEEEPPCPVEKYGVTKLEGEKILFSYADRFSTFSIRCPTIVDEGRLGLLAILYEFIDEGRTVWTVGKGNNRYQFIYAKDLVDACISGFESDASGVFNIGSDNVPTFAECYRSVIAEAGSKSRVKALPERLTKGIMKLTYNCGLSPLGPYQYRMISQNFVFDTSKIKRAINWMPTLTNEEMLLRAFKYYRENRDALKRRSDVSAHKQPAKMGIIRLLKWIS
jgi:nucleoside-diphosphate-sugar epimerase